MKYYIIAGEASGDLHASDLMRGLHAVDPACEIRFWGGDAMAAEGGTLVRHYRDTAVMGIVEILGKAPRILRNLAFCKKDLLAWKPDAVILVDYPGFNLKIARFAHGRGLKVFYYIAPKVWAHKAWRIKNLRRDVDALYCIFPFELEWFRKHGVEPRYFGNPLSDRIARTQFRPLEEGSAPRRRIALLAGSRQAELRFLMPRFAALEKLLAADPQLSEYKLTVAGAPSLGPDDYRGYLPEGSKIEVIFGRTYDILAASQAAVISSGTASLEAALIGTPQVVCYGFNQLTWLIARLTVKVPYVSLANLILGRPLLPELLQSQASPEAIFQELKSILTDTGTRSRMQAGYTELRRTLGQSGSSEHTAKDIYETIARI